MLLVGEVWSIQQPASHFWSRAAAWGAGRKKRKEKKKEEEEALMRLRASRCSHVSLKPKERREKGDSALSHPVVCMMCTPPLRYSCKGLQYVIMEVHLRVWWVNKCNHILRTQEWNTIKRIGSDIFDNRCWKLKKDSFMGSGGKWRTCCTNRVEN